MKTILILASIAVLLFISAGCEKLDKIPIDSVVGTYRGILSYEAELKSVFPDKNAGDSAMAEVISPEEGVLEVHCYGGMLDTTFILNYYENHDSVMVCLAGDEFQHMYGHTLGAGHMGGGMMNDIQKGETTWMHHMSDEHQEGDDHFGGFDMTDGSFTYSFRMSGTSETPYLKFHGMKTK